MAHVHHVAKHQSSVCAFVLFPDAYWQLKQAQLESSHSLAGRVNTLAERTAVSPAAPRGSDTGSRRHLLVFEVTLPAVVPVAFSELLSESVANTAVTRAVVKQGKCCFRATPVIEAEGLHKSVQNVRADLLALRYTWLAGMSLQQRGHEGHCQGIADDQAESGLFAELKHLFHGRFLRTSSQVMPKT